MGLDSIGRDIGGHCAKTLPFALSGELEEGESRIEIGRCPQQFGRAEEIAWSGKIVRMTLHVSTEAGFKLSTPIDNTERQQFCVS